VKNMKKFYKRPVTSLFWTIREGILKCPSLSGVGSRTKGEKE